MGYLLGRDATEDFWLEVAKQDFIDAKIEELRAESPIFGGNYRDFEAEAEQLWYEEHGEKYLY